jgi:hypothetical protein
MLNQTNGKPYNGKDIYICPQAPERFLLTITPEKTEIRKIGKNGFSARLSNQVYDPKDINKMHEEINHIIYNSDESSLSNKNTGCMLTILLLLIPFSVLFYLIL